MRIRSMRIATLVVAIFLVLAPTSVWAYSYGDANTEDVAETFKLVVSSLGKSPVDWNTAQAAHKERRDEIASHFGESVAATLDADFKARKTTETIANYKAILIMNLDRRFENALHDYSDYTKAKLLLAKARATFETLSPYAESKLSSAKLDGLTKDFDVALDAIGNPGLFGVGKKDPDEAALKAAVNRIYSAVRPLFPFTPYKAEPSKPAAGTGTTAKPETGTSTGGTTKPSTGATTGSTTKPSTGTGSTAGSSTTKPSDNKPDKSATTSGSTASDKPAANDSKSGTDTSTSTNTTDKSATDDTSKETSAEAPADDAAAPDQSSNADAEEQAPADDANKAADDTKAADTADNAAVTNDAEATNNTGSSGNDTAVADDTATADAAAAAEPEVIDGTKAHAPMAHESKTNPAITISVIAGVVLVGAGAVWWARRKGIF
ncbi:hypothetical protein [Paenibacillus sp. OV219]|uniref:hypothetical protein n=1 Tax=Paenibacillus sp. OV219 TaxID=1884377 RepID=UPI0008BBBD8F|nr:hypothetical protein [Paenibacillus sp. OV219]SEN62207.1 hypothetical protein SAMN05518847_103343 [Paenibacillus sp. OV219]